MKITEMRVHMDCRGCETKVKNALQKLKGVEEVSIDMPQQKVTVNGWADEKKILKTVRRTGCRAELWQNPEQYYLHNQQLNGPPLNLYSQPQPSSSYNYYKHGYDNTPLAPNHHAQSSLFTNHSSHSALSDDNPHACSIM